MAEEKKVESSEEDEKKEESKEEAEEESADESEDESKKSEEEKTEEKEEDFEKEEETVSSNKHNQTIRKLREAELEKKALEKKLEDAAPKKEEPDKEEDDIDDEFFEEEETEEKKEDTSAIVDKKLKPVMEALKKREVEDRKKDRTAFFDAHPEYLNDSEKWNGLLEELNVSINPNSEDGYFQQLTKAHILFSGQNVENQDIADKKKEMAGDAASGGSEAKSGAAKEEFTAEDRIYMKDFNISEDGMRAAKEKIKSGSMRILT